MGYGDDKPKAKSGSAAWWWVGGTLIALFLIGLAVGPSNGRVEVGAEAVVARQGAKGASFAVDDQAFNQMLDGQNAGTSRLLAPLVKARRAFVESNGARVLVLEKGVGSARVQVVDGANLGSEGWVQLEFLAPAPAR